MKIRKIAKQDTKEYEALRDIWVKVFGDTPSDVDSLYDGLSATGYILEEDGVIKSCLTVYEAGTFNNEKMQVIYAVSTLPESRGKGYASKLVQYAKQDIESQGFTAITCPASQELVRFYSKLGFYPNFMAMERSVVPDEETIMVNVQPINHRQYGKYRESFLKDNSHIVATDELLKQVKKYSINESGMLLINNGDAICIIDGGTEDEMFISELLVNPLLLDRSSEIIYEIAAGLAGLFESSKVTFKTVTHLVYTDESGNHLSSGTFVQAMSGNDEPEVAYYGLPME